MEDKEDMDAFDSEEDGDSGAEGEDSKEEKDGNAGDVEKDKAICKLCKKPFTPRHVGKGKPEQICWEPTCRTETKCSKCGNMYQRANNDENHVCLPCKYKYAKTHKGKGHKGRKKGAKGDETPDDDGDDITIAQSGKSCGTTTDILKSLDSDTPAEDPFIRLIQLQNVATKAVAERESMIAAADRLVEKSNKNLRSFIEAHYLQLKPVIEKIAAPVMEQAEIEKKREEHTRDAEDAEKSRKRMLAEMQGRELPDDDRQA